MNLSDIRHPATAISIAALVVAISGGAFAAGSAINGRSIENGTVSVSKLAPSLRSEIATSARVTTYVGPLMTCPAGSALVGGVIANGGIGTSTPMAIATGPLGSVYVIQCAK